MERVVSALTANGAENWRNTTRFILRRVRSWFGLRLAHLRTFCCDMFALLIDFQLRRASPASQHLYPNMISLVDPATARVLRPPADVCSQGEILLPGPRGLESLGSTSRVSRSLRVASIHPEQSARMRPSTECRQIVKVDGIQVTINDGRWRAGVPIFGHPAPEMRTDSPAVLNRIKHLRSEAQLP